MNTEVVEKQPLEFHDVVKSEDFTAVTSLFNVDTKLSSLGKRFHPVCLGLLPGEEKCNWIQGY
jgi:hypothetical protein